MIKKIEGSPPGHLLYEIGGMEDAFEALLKTVLHFRGKRWRVCWLPPGIPEGDILRQPGYVGGAECSE